MHIFFDVDGVLNKKSDWIIRYSLNRDCLDTFQEVCRQLKKKYGNLHLVLISTWRAGISNNGNDSRQMQNLTEQLKERGLEISGQTPVSNKGRQAEVEYYIRRNNVEEYIIIDDDPSLYASPEDIVLYCPDYHTGLKKEDVKQIVKMV